MPLRSSGAARLRRQESNHQVRHRGAMSVRNCEAVRKAIHFPPPSENIAHLNEVLFLPHRRFVTKSQISFELEISGN